MECECGTFLPILWVVQNAPIPAVLLLQTKANRLSFECLKSSFFFLVMPNAIFVWKDYTRSSPAEKTGLWKMVSENEINHAKVVQGVFEMNIWLWTAKLPPSSSSSFSQLFERVLRAGKQVNGPNCTFPHPPLLIPFAPMQGISLTCVFNKWAQIQEKNYLNSCWLSTAIPKENKLWILKFLKLNLWF